MRRGRYVKHFIALPDKILPLYGQICKVMICTYSRRRAGLGKNNKKRPEGRKGRRNGKRILYSVHEVSVAGEGPELRSGKLFRLVCINTQLVHNGQKLFAAGKGIVKRGFLLMCVRNGFF